MADETSGTSEGLGRAEEHEAPGKGARKARALTALRVVLAGLVLLAGLAVAAPTRRAAAPAAGQACSAGVAAAPETGVIVLPPGHPPIPGARAHGQIIVRLPPGHPPIDERQLGAPIPAAPLEPIFQAPTTVDL